MGLGYLIATAIFGFIWVVMVSAQILAKNFHPFVYWTTIVATTTIGTTMADFVDRSLKIGYSGGTLIIFVLLMISLCSWYLTLGSVSVHTVKTPRVELFYWLTITFSQTLGTALGDWAADTAGLGYGGGAIIFSILLSMLAAAYYWSHLSRTLLFWTAFILTRPMGAVMGDFLDKPLSAGGLDLSRYTISGLLVVFMVVCVMFSEYSRKVRKHH